MKNTNREKKIGNIWGATGGNYAGNVYDKNYIAPVINTCSGGYREPIIVEEEIEGLFDGENENYILCGSEQRS